MACGFTLNHYKECLVAAKAAKYTFLTMSDFDSSNIPKKTIFLRHDIDMNPALALNLAKIENLLGIKATYFIRMHAPYNPFSYENSSIIKELIKQGHEIGLHYEFGFAELLGEEEVQMIKRSKQVLEIMIGRKIAGISAHEPARSGFTLDSAMIKKLGFKYNAYSDSFMKNLKYISDSSARWREGCMCGYIGKEDKLYILTHPFWWYNKSSIENY